MYFKKVSNTELAAIETHKQEIKYAHLNKINSPEYLKLQEEAVEKRAEYDKFKQENLNNLNKAKEMHNNLFEKIKNYLNSNYPEGNYSREAIDEVYLKFSKEFSALKTQADNIKPLNFNFANEYNLIFNDLQSLSPYFIFYAPTKYVVSAASYNSFNKLEQKYLDEFEPRIEKDELNKNNIFRKKNLKFFPNHINDMLDEDYNGIAFSLSKKPEMFYKLDSSKKSLITSGKILYHTLDLCPTVYKMLDKKTRDRVIIERSSFLGALMLRDPSILDVLPDDYFRPEEIKHMFIAGVSKTKIKEILGERIHKFPTLEFYCNNNIFHHSTNTNNLSL